MRRRSAVLIGVGAGVFALAGASAAVWLLTRPAGPEQAVQAYLSALEAGDAAAALAVVDEPHEASTVAEALAGATALAEKGVIEATEAGATDATVTVTFTLDGAPEEGVLHLANTAEGWRITDGAFGTASITSTLGDAVRIGGALVPVAGPATLLPAVYPVTAAPTGILDGTATLTIAPGGAAEASVTAVASPQATVLAQQQLDAYLAECTKAAMAVPLNCGIRVPWAADLTSLTGIVFRIDKAPVLALAADGTSFAATGGVLVATATGPSRSGGTGTFAYRADDWAVRGSASYSGDELMLSVR